MYVGADNAFLVEYKLYFCAGKTAKSSRSTHAHAHDAPMRTAEQASCRPHRATCDRRRRGGVGSSWAGAGPHDVQRGLVQDGQRWHGSARLYLRQGSRALVCHASPARARRTGASSLTEPERHPSLPHDNLSRSDCVLMCVCVTAHTCAISLGHAHGNVTHNPRLSQRDEPSTGQLIEHYA